ncbi:MAG: ATP-binding protein [Chloroflexota bacterium]
MPKKQTGIPPESFETFGELLRYLRERVHLSQRDLAAQAGYHYSYISYLENNARIPDLAVIKARFIPALDLRYEEAWVERLLELASKAQKSPSGKAPPSSEALPLSPGLSNLTPMVGRKSEAAAVQASLLEPGIRVVTLLGPPGVGKTRLAQHVAEQLASRFQDGAVFVDLAPIQQPELVLPSLCEALGVQDSSSTASRLALLQGFIQKKHLLVVLDNFEQVLSAARLLPSLLSGAPRVKLLVTSREALRIAGEHEFPLHPLEVPGGEALPLQTLEEIPAVRLFVDRARAVRPDFTLTDENALQVVEICRRLDGLPLAIELAAARIQTIGLGAMLDQFHRRFQWLTRGRRDQPAWRKTLLGAIEWSDNLLSAPEQTLLARLSVFAGGWSLEAAEAVCSDDETCPRESIFDLLLGLVDRSLVVADADGGTSRYRFLDTIRHYAQQKLEEGGEWPALRNRHLAHVSAWASRMASQIDQAAPREFRRQMEQEHNNLRAALDWGMTPQADLTDQLRLAVSVGGIWLKHSNYREALERVEACLPLAVAPEQEALRGRLLYLAGALSYWRDNIEQAKAYCLSAVELAARSGEEITLADASYYLGEAYREQGMLSEAHAALERCVDLCRRHGHIHRLSLALTSLGLVMYHLGSHDHSDALLFEATRVAVSAKNAWAQSYAMRVQADTLRLDGKYPEALHAYDRSLRVATSIDDRISMGISLANMALVSNLLESYEDSAQYASRALEMFQAIGNDYQQPFPHRVLAYAALHQGSLLEAREQALESLTGNHALGHKTGMLAAFLALAEVEIHEENHARAGQIVSMVTAEMAQSGAALMALDQKALERLRRQIQAGKKLRVQPIGFGELLLAYGVNRELDG